MNSVEPLLSISRQLDQYLIALILTLPRIYAFLAASQILNSGAVPGVARIAAILSLACAAAPINLDYAEAFDRSVTQYVQLFAKEYAIGFVLGYLVSWIFWIVETAGSLIDNQRGAGIASSIDPLQGHESSPLGNLMSLAFLTYIYATASVLPIIRMIYHSYAAWPVTQSFPIISNDFPRMVLGVFDSAMRMGFNLAAPVVAVMFMAEFALAMISRFSPQVQVFILAMPIKSLLGIFMMISYVSIMFPFIDRQIASVPPLADALYSLLEAGAVLSPTLRTPP